GVDHHHADPLSHLRTTMSLYPELWLHLAALADECCAGRWVALAGGGYDPCNAPPRAWAMLMACMAGVDLPADLPAAWHAIARNAACGDPATGWLSEDDPPDLSGSLTAAPAVDEAILATREASSLLR
ncbi:MAG: acetoin utilization protein AcuC, partial [Actinomycetota bacterium]